MCAVCQGRETSPDSRAIRVRRCPGSRQGSRSGPAVIIPRHRVKGIDQGADLAEDGHGQSPYGSGDVPARKRSRSSAGLAADAPSREAYRSKWRVTRPRLARARSLPSAGWPPAAGLPQTGRGSPLTGCSRLQGSGQCVRRAPVFCGPLEVGPVVLTPLLGRPHAVGAGALGSLHPFGSSLVEGCEGHGSVDAEELAQRPASTSSMAWSHVLPTMVVVIWLVMGGSFRAGPVGAVPGLGVHRRRRRVAACQAQAMRRLPGRRPVPRCLAPRP